MLQKRLLLSFLALLILGFQEALAQTSQNPSSNGTSSSTSPSTGLTTLGPSTNGNTGGSTSTVTTTTQAVTTTSNGHLDPSINQICPQNSGVNDKIRRKALEMHNYRRSSLAMGQVTKKNNNYMPRASNMIELKYDCTLEVTARDRAQSCATNEIQGGLENKHMVAVSSVKDRVEAMEKVRHCEQRCERMVEASEEGHTNRNGTHVQRSPSIFAH
ncbi:hypothetical protein ANCCEY_13365 [Ancylostoma ceylanicum]|uniref:SCP domain-containing protein n=1 Tax=Ancylostoma ceylanicum TaxID=53326 RepID=A0A0D6L7P1_9BILA|nr:hypothetical protein ANCCEY_13365 [Ancylostoma ceylanicum]